MKSISFVTAVALGTLLIGSASAFADQTAKPATAKTASAKTVDLVCPVTGEKIASVKDAAGHSVYKGKTYYFCCSGCKPMFDADPAKYVKK